MNKLAMYRRNYGMTQPQMAERLQTVEPRIDAGMVSRYEKGVCLPTNEQIEVLEDTLRTDRFDIFGYDDLNLLRRRAEDKHVGTRQGHEKCDSGDCKVVKVHNFHFRLPKERVKAIPRDLYKVLGFRTANAWFEHVHHQAMHEYEQIKKAAPKGD